MYFHLNILVDINGIFINLKKSTKCIFVVVQKSNLRKTLRLLSNYCLRIVLKQKCDISS